MPWPAAYLGAASPSRPTEASLHSVWPLRSTQLPGTTESHARNKTRAGGDTRSPNASAIGVERSSSSRPPWPLGLASPKEANCRRPRKSPPPTPGVAPALLKLATGFGLPASGSTILVTHPQTNLPPRGAHWILGVVVTLHQENAYCEWSSRTGTFGTKIV